MSARASSPTPSAISDHRKDIYSSLKDFLEWPPTVPVIKYRRMAKTYFKELGKHLAAASPERDYSPRPKLIRLTSELFHELSMDIYDKLLRRTKEKEGLLAFLPEKRSSIQSAKARQTMATLHASRFRDLSSDVYFELARCYPEFMEYNFVTDSMIDRELQN
ncbi:hypothetical protein CPB84DRAFT_1293923 [Gymnopilus junonius]|uniref:GIT Spa2 homology (SHD) domain-containing protein n=1 Tax=Gymnopilus junonius TaxID=109634 RepID=A0A9P5NLR2_GYMJU|nr:hypothetical protein CPB84DRAFT_1293923 [Gymnopilus junonius]